MSTVEQRPVVDETLGRRAIWVLALAVVTLVFPSFGLGLVGAAEWWNVTLFVLAQAAFVLAVGAAALALGPQPALVPQGIRRLRPDELLGWALAFLWLGLALTALNVSIQAIDAIGDADDF